MGLGDSGDDADCGVSIEDIVGGPRFMGAARGVVWRKEHVCP